MSSPDTRDWNVGRGFDAPILPIRGRLGNLGHHSPCCEQSMDSCHRARSLYNRGHWDWYDKYSSYLNSSSFQVKSGVMRWTYNTGIYDLALEHGGLKGSKEIVFKIELTLSWFQLDLAFPTSGRPRWEHLLLTAKTSPLTSARRIFIIEKKENIQNLRSRRALFYNNWDLPWYQRPQPQAFHLKI